MSITIGQAGNLKYGELVRQIRAISQDTGEIHVLTPVSQWRVNGKIKLWKRDPERFQLPIRHGLYNYGYLTNDNCHLFTLDNKG